MKKYIIVMITFSVLYILGVIIFAAVSNISSETDVDTLLLNDITKSAEENINNLDTLESVGGKVSFYVLDENGALLYKSLQHGTEDLSHKINVEYAMKHKYSYKYIIHDDSIIGVVILQDEMNDKYMRMRRNLIIGLIAGGVIIIIGMVLYSMYVRRRIIAPFEEMKHFAGRVAEGRLDEPLLMDRDNMFGAFTESFDIMREELAESRAREMALQKKEKELIASLSHDLKTPITGIKLIAELLKAKIENNDAIDNNESELENNGSELENNARKFREDFENKLDNIYKKADQIDVLVSDLFTSTLDDLGEFTINLSDEESSVLSDIVKRNDDRNLALESEVPSVLINIDKKRMNQVVGNIIINSYKYAGTGISVNYRIIDKYLEMDIRDYGEGVSEKETELITNKFYRGENAAASNCEGSGLGLYIARILMEKQGGELRCENKAPGFSVVLLIPLS